MIHGFKKILLRRAEDIIVILWSLVLSFYFFASIFLLNAFEERFYLPILMLHFSTLYFWGAIGAVDYHLNRKKRLILFRYPITTLLLTFIFFVFTVAIYFGKTDIIEFIGNTNRDYREIAGVLFFTATISAIFMIGPFLFGYIVGASIRIIRMYFRKFKSKNSNSLHL